MKIKNTLQILEDFLTRDNFQVIYKDQSFPMMIDAGITEFSSGEALSYLLSSSLTGSKSIGFFKSIQYVSHRYFLRGECLLITTEIPEAISVPTIFCKDIDFFPAKLPAALKISFETKLPVMLVLSENIVNNYTDTDMGECDTDRVTPYISQAVLDNKYGQNELMEQYLLAETLLAKLFDKPTGDLSQMAFSDSGYPFFDYIVPFVRNKVIDSMSSMQKIKVPDVEFELMNYVKKHFALDVNIESYKANGAIHLKREICPGCPFVSLFNNVDLKDKIVVTDIQCKTIHKAYSLNLGSVSEVAGYSCNMKNSKLCFIGNSSNFHPKYLKHMENVLFYILKDIDSTPPGLPKVSRPSKMKKVSSVFPYSCNNIANYSKMVVKPRKCNCFTNGSSYICVDETSCPAIFIKDNFAQINPEKCTGCGSCKVVCPHGAIK